MLTLCYFMLCFAGVTDPLLPSGKNGIWSARRWCTPGHPSSRREIEKAKSDLNKENSGLLVWRRTVVIIIIIGL